MFNISEFKKAVKNLGREASNIDEFCKEVKLYMEAEKKVADNRKLQSLNRHTNHLGETYIFGKFGTGENSIMVTIAYLGKNAQDAPETQIEKDYRGGVPITLSEVQSGYYKFPEPIKENSLDDEKKAIREKIVNIYTFEELSPEMQDKVLDNYRNINVDEGSKWYDITTDFWAEKLTEMGWGDIDIAFSGFWSQGDGASFTAKNIDVQKLINTYNITNQFPNIYTHDVKVDITRSGRYVHKHSTSLSFEDYSEETPESEKELVELEKFLTEKMIDLNQEIYTELEEEYTYQISDEAVKQTILANNYEFNEGGKIEASKKKADYQGWKDYNTWNLALWLDQNQFELPEGIVDVHEAADYIKEIVTEDNPLLGTFSTYSDILGNALLSIDYREIAEHILSMRE